jgi:hypothetical protein
MYRNYYTSTDILRKRCEGRDGPASRPMSRLREMGAKSLADLVRMVDRVGIHRPKP